MSNLAQSLHASIRCLNSKFVLWPDKERQWEKAIPVLRQELPELLCLGAYKPEEGTGPAIWLRCAIAGKIPEFALAEGKTPILYLPGVSKQDLRAVQDCPQELKPLVELQFRGRLWSQHNGKDWTIMSYLVSDKGGLGLEVASDAETKKAMQNALIPLLREDIEELKGKRLDRDYFNSLLTGGDPYRDLLAWLDQEDRYRQTLSAEQWQAFCSTCKSQFGIDPLKDGLLRAVEFLVSVDVAKPKASSWQKVWDRYCDAPGKYPSLPSQIRKLSVPDDWMYVQNLEHAYDRYPQWNTDREDDVRQAFLAMGNLSEKNARAKIHELEQQHGRRRELIWAELGEAKYAWMLYELVAISGLTEQSLATGSLVEIAERYSEQLWHVDRAMVELLEKIDSNDDLRLISGIIDLIYIPWMESSARYLQTIGLSQADETRAPISYKDVEAVIFVDGLRFDCARILAQKLSAAGFITEEKYRWTGLPTITATCKPILVEAMLDASAQKKDAARYEALSSYEFKKTLEKNNWQILGKNEAIPAPTRTEGKLKQKLWLEYGNLDELGHSQGWKLPKYIDSTLNEILNAIKEIFKAGWSSVQVLSDHGWLLSPMGLPKANLPACLSEGKWPRYATLKVGSNTDERTYPWYWDSGQQIAFAEGISCYRSGMEYAHGGLSIQECLLLDIKLQKPEGAQLLPTIQITDVKWTQMRCSIAIKGMGEGLFFDIRTAAGDAQSSVALSAKPIKSDQSASVVVENENLEGETAYIVILDQDKETISQIKTTIGGKADERT